VVVFVRAISNVRRTAKRKTRMHHLYRLGNDGVFRFRTFGPVNLRDSKRIEKAYRENGA
jgi:hypothetical protein